MIYEKPRDKFFFWKNASMLWFFFHTLRDFFFRSYHHAGLSLEERSLIEEAYSQGSTKLKPFFLSALFFRIMFHFNFTSIFRCFKCAGLHRHSCNFRLLLLRKIPDFSLPHSFISLFFLYILFIFHI